MMATTDSPDTKLYPLAVILPLLSLLSCLLAIPPLILHAKNRNLPAAALVSWSLILNIFNIVNAFLWPTDDFTSRWSGGGLCDVEVKFMAAGYVAVPGTLLCIFRGLAMVLDTNNAILVPSKTQRWRNRLMEYLFCAIVPILAMVAHVFWQKNRYMIFAISGCVNNFDESWASLVLEWIWPPSLCLGASYYCCLVIARIRRYRNDFELILHSANSSMSKSRFLRLFFVAFTMLVAIIPLQGFVFWRNINLSLPWHPYSWNMGHEPEWSTIIKVPTKGTVFFDRWTSVTMGFIVFIFCGLGADAKNSYCSALKWLGLGKCFPRLTWTMDPEPRTATHDFSSSSTLVDITIGQAKRLFTWCKPSLADIEKGVQHPDAAKGTKASWISFLFRRAKPAGSDRRILLGSLSVPNQAVLTSAWAGTTRGSSEYHGDLISPTSQVKDSSIHIRQVISQQSEVKP